MIRMDSCHCEIRWVITRDGEQPLLSANGLPTLLSLMQSYRSRVAAFSASAEGADRRCDLRSRAVLLVWCAYCMADQTNCHATLREGANVLRVRVCDVSQGGAKIECNSLFPQGADIVISLPGMEPQRGIACWVDGGYIGIAFNRLLPLGELVAWLQEQREYQRGAA